MPDFTNRLGLILPDSPESADIDQINANMQRLDLYGAGPLVVTSTTRPTGTNRFIGLRIYETDTKFLLTWDGTNWIGYPWHIRRHRTSSGALPAGTFTAISMNASIDPSPGFYLGDPADWGLTSFTQATAEITIPEEGVWMIEFAGAGPVSDKIPRLTIGNEFVAGAACLGNQFSGVLNVTRKLAKGTVVSAAMFTSAAITMPVTNFTNYNANTYLSATRVKG